jgi:hypothetical protein
MIEQTVDGTLVMIVFLVWKEKMESTMVIDAII